MRNLPFVSIISAFLFIIILCGGIAFAQETTQQPLLPHAFYGTVEVAGQPSEAGIRVEARGDGINVDVNGNPIYTHEGGYGGFGGMSAKILVQGSIKPGTPIEFLVGGVVAEVYDVKAQKGWDQSYPYTPGDVTELNLRISSSVTPEATGVAAGATTSPTAQTTVAATQAAGKASVPGVSPGVTLIVTQAVKAGGTVDVPATSAGTGQPEAGTDTGEQSPEPDTVETAAPGTTGQSFSSTWMIGAALIIIVIIGGAAYIASRKKEGDVEEKTEEKIIEESEETEENIENEETGEPEKTEESEETEENK
ncbi:MAG TPA: hypothetical protein VMW63_10670 [Methanoregulaceae archaeon]|nr:hypothetical protein [Methanoregulaceae archaeon]